MATQPTNLPVPSESYRDLKFNAGRIDEFVTSMGWTYTDRIGNKHYTIEGINHIVQEAMTSIGYVILAGQTFTTGSTLNSPNEILLNEADNSYYKWTGTFASGGKEVPPDSTPESSGGIGPGKWLNVGDSSLRSDLATGGKATLIGYNAETVQAALTRHDTDFSRIVSLDERTTVPPNEYSGNKHWTPIFEEGHQLTNYVFKTPVHVDFQFSSDPLNVATGPLFTFGRDDLSGSAAFWSQDSYELRNAVIDGGTSEIAVFEPWTAHTATVENNRILSNGEPGKYAINFKAQNWWPIVRGNTFADYTDKGGNFCKAADDEGSATDKYSGNSRLTFTQNRCKWLGAGTGGVMLYSSGVAASITDNSSENSLIAIKLGYPSSYAVIDRLYNEMLAGGQNVIEIGDNIAAPVNNYTGISIKNVYCNFHGLNTNSFIRTANNSVLLNEIILDDVNITNTPPVTAYIPPIVKINDLAFQKIIAGRISAANMPLLPMTTNYVAVVDKYGIDIPALNSDLVYIDNATVSIPANASTAIAPGWFAKSSGAATFTRTGAGTPRQDLRNARYIGSLSAIAGATSTIYFQFPRADLINYEFVTIQFLINTSQAVTNVVKTSIYNPDGTKYQLDLRNLDSAASWSEATITISSRDANSSGSLVTVEIGNSHPSAMTTYVTGFRMNRGQYGMCGRANALSYAETERMKSDYSYITP
ncbi:TPA: hypothetical protein ACVFFV_001673 [Enterobacter cloacae]|uniref:tail fiber/spike domain-containing protein n=1 Tax=Enterobacter cloacae TaxID=550 RepID=UPI0013789DEB|nr:hypothetical protein [Enterobacter cloacae]ELG6440383.1 hypothetical protein [Enterobacter cloacae]NBF99996.1 hypothetical protein [Enterobacter cloacae]